MSGNLIGASGTGGQSVNNTTVAPGTYTSVTVDQQGRVTGGSNPSSIVSGITFSFSTQTGGPTSSQLYWFNSTSGTTLTTNTAVNVARVKLPANSTWTFLAAIANAVVAGNSVDFSIWTSPTLNGSYTEDTASKLNFVNSDGSQAEKTSTLTIGASPVWFCFGTKANGISYTSWVAGNLVRLT